MHYSKNAHVHVRAQLRTCWQKFIILIHRQKYIKKGLAKWYNVDSLTKEYYFQIRNLYYKKIHYSVVNQ